jgi:23S rRNA (adenine2503-C2)-methyltransferase
VKIRESHTILNISDGTAKPAAIGLSPDEWLSFFTEHFPQEKNIGLLVERALRVWPDAVAKGLPQSAEPLSSFGQRFLNKLQETFSWAPALELVTVQTSQLDGSRKYLFRTFDNLLVETVLIPEPERFTVCLSTQVGCAQGCTFCHTGKMGLKRNLTAAEIVSQFFLAQCLAESSSPTIASNIVFMGMGEPLDNLTELKKSLRIFTHPKGFRLSANKVTVSTVGLPEQIEELLTTEKCGLALSLHSPFESERSRILPTNRKHSLASVLAVMKKFNKRYMIQYTLLRGVNDSQSHAEELALILKDMNVLVNVIPLNEHESTQFRRPELNHVTQFQSALKKLGLVCTVRLSKGRDIEAACGQLVDKYSSRI